MRSGEIDQLLWVRKIDNATGRAQTSADVISKSPLQFWGGVLDAQLFFLFFFHHSLRPSVPGYLEGDLGRLSAREYLPQRLTGNAMCLCAT